MIFQSDPYVTLVASLPAIGLLSEKAPPITRARLEERLRALSPEDRAEISAIGRTLSWEAMDLAAPEPELLARAGRTIAGLRHADLRGALRDRLEIRTLIAALRRRARGEAAPAADGPAWGFGPYVERIRAGWALPDFGLGRVFPWASRARELLEAGDHVGMERLALEQAWRAVLRREEGHSFDFEAVAFYVMRWNMADRWSRYDADAAAARFQEMLDAALAPAPQTGRAA